MAPPAYCVDQLWWCAQKRMRIRNRRARPVEIRRKLQITYHYVQTNQIIIIITWTSARLLVGSSEEGLFRETD